PDASGEALGGCASRRVRKRHKRLAAGLARLGGMSPEERHRVRIRAKRLRYVVEGLASVFPDAHAAKAYAKRLAKLQDTLGRANDAATGVRLLDAIGPHESLAPRAREWLCARVSAEDGKLDSLAREIADAHRFWHRRDEGTKKEPAPRPAPG